MTTDIDKLIAEYQSEFEKTDLYQDIGSYKEMTMLELSKKIPKWKSNFKITFKPIYDTNHKLDMVRYVNKFCKDCDKDQIFEKNICKYINKKYTYVKWEFVRVYLRLFRNLVLEANEFFNTKKINQETEFKQRMDQHQKTEVICNCGGKYSLRNKQKHLKTNKHILYCQLSN